MSSNNKSEYTFSQQQDKECYGKQCACLDCRPVQGFCVYDPCYQCEGRGKDRADGFCTPYEEDVVE